MPTPPGALGVGAAAGDMISFLGEFDAWIRERRSELDVLDAQIIATNRQAELNSDITLAMTIWQAIATKQREVLQIWDSGRVTKIELEKLSSLLWGRLDTSQQPSSSLSSMAVSLPEAGKLCDALVASMRTKLNTDPDAEHQLTRLRNLGTTMERIRDQIALEPAMLREAAQTKLTHLVSRLSQAQEKRGRGADIGGLLGPLEEQSTLLERDLIVGAAQRREGVELLEQTRAAKARIETLQTSVKAAHMQAEKLVWPLPAPISEGVESLGQLPNTAAGLGEYAASLKEIEPLLEKWRQELDEASNLVAKAKQQLAELHKTAEILDPKPEILATLHLSAASALETEPVVIPTVQYCIAAYQSQINFALTTRKTT